jgi:hypothetical protein
MASTHPDPGKSEVRSIPLRGGFSTADPRLDRLPSQNAVRLALYPVSAVLDRAPPAPATRRWRRGPVLDQSPRPGYDGSGCVGFSGTNLLRSSPVRNKNVARHIDANVADRMYRDIREPYAIDTYHACQRVDEWTGEAYAGTSVDALGKTLLARGLLTEYRWVTRGADELAEVVRHSPSVAGTWWWSGMDDADGNGGIALPTGWKRGGHAWLVDGVVVNKTIAGRYERVWLRGYQSWGRWGADKRGTFYVPLPAMNELLADEGEAMIATEVLLGA